MKTHLLLVIVCVTLMNSLLFSVMSGCGIFQAVPLAFAWHAVSMCRNTFFADNHARVVAAVGALFSACFLAGLLTLVALIARRRGLLVSHTSLTKMFAIGAIIYLLLGLVTVPVGPCFCLMTIPRIGICLAAALSRKQTS
jgi:hypothetical protein